MRAILAGLVLLLSIAPALADFDTLLAAARTGSLALVRAELAAGTDPNPPSWHHGYSPLQFAAGNGEGEMMQLLLEAGADTEYRDHNGERALLWAAYSGTPETVRLLLDAGSPPDAADPYGETPLMTASWYGHRDMVAALLAAGADVNRHDQSSLTALHLAARGDDLALVDMLLAAGANPNVFSDSLYETPLHEAAVRSEPAIVAALVAANAALEPRDYDGMTPLHAAAAGGNGATVAALIAAGADPDASRTDGDTPILSALAPLNELPGKELAIAALAEVTHDKDRAFATALSTGRLAIAMRLLERGATVDAIDAQGRSALANAAQLPGMTMYQLLVLRGADLGKFGGEALLAAARHGNAAVARALLDRGVSIEARDVAGTTPLLAAAFGGQVEMVRLLLAAGADPSVRDSFGRGALDQFAIAAFPFEERLAFAERSAAYHPTAGIELDLSLLREAQEQIRELLLAAQ